MLEITTTRTINKPIADVWHVVVDGFCSPHEWAYGTPTCRPGTDAEGVDRVCDTESGELRDTITLADEERHVLEFSVEGLPFFVRSTTSRWEMTAVSDTATELSVTPRIDTLPVIGHLAEIPMRKALTKLYPGLLDDLAVFIETGEPSARKRQELTNAR